MSCMASASMHFDCVQHLHMFKICMHFDCVAKFQSQILGTAVFEQTSV